ncbi:ATP synthase subunit I [Sporomusa malonica]|uniref:ATP synthase I chain n=1 Tax=Sporomusa malonica TaxID=112901 RepID=A0A1W1YQ93_9FIRM|nr:ATP synthase subunit I [Sporomusa malonica]SMC38296.1 ATP synthase I chain [Sporomusa malonica]
MFKVGFADNYAAQVKQTLMHLAAWGLFVTLGALLSNQVFIIPGLLTGWSGSVIYFLLMCRRVKKSAELSPGQAVASMRVGWLVRFSFLISILVLSVHVPGIDFWAAVVGLFSLHIVLMINAVVIVVSGLIPNLGKSKFDSGRE